MKNFWNSLKKPIMVLAPMDDVTDVVFREIVNYAAKSDVYFTEFTSSDALCSEGRKFTLPRLKFTKNQRPIVAQIWGKNPDNIYESAKLVHELGFDAIDINMGCPDKNVVKKGSGAGLIKSFSDAAKVIEAARKGSGKMPVSVKTRLGFDRIITTDWIKHLLQQSIDVLTIHGRIATEMSKYPANWEEIGKAVKIRDRTSPKTLIIGNGDIMNYKQAIEVHQKYGVDGVMIGRGIFSDPWVFEKKLEKLEKPTLEYLKLLEMHIKLFKKTWGDSKHFAVLRRFLKMYIRNFAGADTMRQKLMECQTIEDLLSSVKNAIKQFRNIESKG